MWKKVFTKDGVEVRAPDAHSQKKTPAICNIRGDLASVRFRGVGSRLEKKTKKIKRRIRAHVSKKDLPCLRDKDALFSAEAKEEFHLCERSKNT